MASSAKRLSGGILHGRSTALVAIRALLLVIGILLVIYQLQTGISLARNNEDVVDGHTDRFAAPTKQNVSIDEAVVESKESPKTKDTTSDGPMAEERTDRTSFEISTAPNPNEKTLAMYQRLYSGFRNQGMAFSAFVMYASENNFTQILLPSIFWKDLFGTNKQVPHEKLFDVVHWNSFYPTLPRFVTYHPEAHREFDIEKRKWKNGSIAEESATSPYAFGRYPRLMNRYKRYTKKLLGQGDNPQLSPVDLSMKRGAFRPHPDLQRHIDGLSGSLKVGSSSYMALHARVEPDMQKHPVCRDKKVIRLQEIFDSLQSQFPEPPVSKLFIAINRPMLEKAGSDPKSENQVAVENLSLLNRVAKEGLWGGKVTVFEAGMPSVKHTSFSAYPGITGSIVDYFLAVGAKIFVGTEVSSFSTDLMAARFYRGNKENYHYLPSGLQLATPQNATLPPRFKC